MPREVKINVSVDSNKAVSNIDTLKKAFQELNKELEKNGKDGALKLKIDLEGVNIKAFKELSSSISKISKSVDLLNTSMEGLSRNGNVLKVTTNNISNVTNNANNIVKNYTKGVNNASKAHQDMTASMIGNLAIINQLRQSFSYLAKDYADLNDKTFSVGIAGEMDISGIEKLNRSFSQLASTVPKSASELAQAVDDLIRTGRSYEESRKIIEEVARLSVASGDLLKDTAGVVTKVMVSLGVNAENAVNTLNTMHSVAIQTASDMNFLSESYKSIAGTIGTYVQSTGLAGEELDNYKQKVLDFAMASTGAMANLGLSASEAGTKLKNFYSRLSAAEKVARNMFDQEMKIGNVMGEDGKLFDYNALANLAQKDLPKAAEEMSKLYISGKLSYQTLQKLFTARHFTEIITLLRQINGDVESFTNGLAKGIDYSNDMYKAMFNITEQSKLLKNNLKDAFQVSLQEGNESLTGLMMLLNDALKNDTSTSDEASILDKFFGNLVVNVGASVVEITALAGAVTILKPILMSLKPAILGVATALGVSTGPVILAIIASLTGLNALISYIGNTAYNSRKHISDLFTAMNVTPKGLDSIIKDMKALETDTRLTLNNIDKINNTDLNNIISYNIGFRDVLSESNKELYDILENLDSINTKSKDLIELKMSTYKDNIAQITSEIEKLKSSLDSIKSEGSTKLLESLGVFNKWHVLDSKGIKDVNKVDEIITNFYNKALSLRESISDDKEYHKALEGVGRNLGISKSGVKKILLHMEMSGYKDVQEKTKNITKEIKDQSDSLQIAKKEYDDYYKEATNVGDKYQAYIKKSMTNQYLNTGTLTTLEGKEYKGMEATKYLFSQDVPNIMREILSDEKDTLASIQKQMTPLLEKEMEGTLNEIDKQLLDNLRKETGERSAYINTLTTQLNYVSQEKKLTDVERGIDKLSSKENLTENESNRLSQLKTEREKILQTMNDIKGNAKELGVELLNVSGMMSLIDEGTWSWINSLEKTPNTLKKSQSYLEILLRSRIQENSEIAKHNVKELEGLDTLKEREKIELESENKKAVARKNSNKYTLESINFSKQQYELELALEKIGKTKGQQVALEYEYRLKTLKANKEISAQELKDAKSALSKRTGGVGGNIVQEMLKTDPTDIKRLEELGKQYTALFPKEMTGEAGKQAKETQKAIIEYIKSAIEDKKAYQDIGVNLANSIDEAIKNISTINPFEKLYEYSAQYISDYKNKIQEAYSSQKDEVWKAYGLEDMSVDDALLTTYEELQLAKEALLDVDLKQQILRKLNLEDEEQLAIYVEALEQKYEDIVKQKDAEISKNEQLLKLEQQRLNVYNNIGSVISKLGSVSNSESLSNLGEVFSSFGDVNKFMADSKNDFKWADITSEITNGIQNGLDKIDTDKVSANLSNAFSSALEHMNMGSSIGSFIGGITGGGQSSTAAGTLAGLATGLAGMSSPYGMAIQAGASLIGGMFDSSSSDQAEADKKTKESNKLYNKNTEALQDLADRMSSLSGGVDSLNSSLISAFSKIPTVSNLNNVTDALTSMYNTMNKTRIFNDVAYQVTKTKSSKGFLGIGGGSTSWTETIEVSVQEMLNKYGFKGAIEDMTSDQLRAFSKWLDDFDMGDSDNFSILADAIEDYAESLDTMEKNIEKFFYDTTMESFEGISSLEQEELRQQIEDFYKELGLQIDDAMSAQIDALAEQMSVMVTIMQDVRSDFVSNWREMGTDAGKTFVQSMSPYIDAILTNISQIYYDVYFSDINDQLEVEFKNLSEKLVELKKQGRDLDWDNVAKELSSSFGDVLYIINATKEETESFNTVLLQLQKQALESGLSLSEIFDLGLVTGTQETVIDTFKDALSSSEANSAFTAIGDMVGETIGEALVNKMIDNMMSDKILEVSAQLDKIVSGNLSFDSLAGLASDAMSVGLMLESERLRYQSIVDMFNWDKDITYQNENSTIEYQTGSSTQSVYNYYLTSTVDAGAVVESDSVERLADELLDIMLEKLKTDKGIDLKKL